MCMNRYQKTRASLLWDNLVCDVGRRGIGPISVHEVEIEPVPDTLQGIGGVGGDHGGKVV
jgi:hypothetical protein